MPIANYTTTVDATKTAMEVQSLLVKHGARQIMTEFDDDGNMSGLKWRVHTPEADVSFKLPLNVEGVYAALCREAPPRFQIREQAYRVAWRILRDWVRAQMAVVEAGLVHFTEVFLPYMLGPHDKTLYGHMVESGFRHFALPEGREEE